MCAHSGSPRKLRQACGPFQPTMLLTYRTDYSIRFISLCQTDLIRIWNGRICANGTPRNRSSRKGIVGIRADLSSACTTARMSLDGDGALHYRKKVASMRAIANVRVEPGPFPWRIVLCLVLSAFFLYNPFLTICTSSTPYGTVQRPPSYRSTLASCELGCGTVQPTKLLISPLRVLLGTEKGLLQQKDHPFPSLIEEMVRVVPRELDARLWFRPPPSL